MIYPKGFLVSVLNDALVSYELSVKKLNPKRLEQIEIIRRMCENAQHDVMIISFLKRISHEMDTQVGWFSWMFAQRSRLSMIIEECIREYRKTERRFSKHQLKNVRRSESIMSENEIVTRIRMPELEEIKEETQQLLALC